MQEEYALQISNQLREIAAQLTLIREVLEKRVQQDHHYIQTKRY